MLILPIKKKWFDMILSGEKKEEYREIKPYWAKRFNFEKNTLYLQRTVIFKNGYRKDSPQIKCYVKIKKGYGREELGAEKNKVYYVLEILNVEKVDDK